MSASQKKGTKKKKFLVNDILLMITKKCRYFHEREIVKIEKEELEQMDKQLKNA